MTQAGIRGVVSRFGPLVIRADVMLEAYLMAALQARYIKQKRLILPFSTMSNKFALSDVTKYTQRYVYVALVSWPDSP